MAAASLVAVPARAEPLRIALVVGNAHYAALPELARCTDSAALVRDGLRDKGFEIIERNDLGRGQFDAAIAGLARRVAAASPAFAALYFCGYAVEFNARSFLLPVSASIARESDVLTQGIISKSLVDSLARVAGSSGFVLLDTFPAPNAGAAGMARLAEQIRPGRFAVIGAVNAAGSGTGPTPAAQAVRDRLVGDRIALEPFVADVRKQVARVASASSYVIAATGPASYVVGGPAEPPAVAPPAPSVAPPPAAAEPASAVQPAAPAAPPPPAAAASGRPAPARVLMVDEAHMTDQDRRQVQAALATLGYYSGRIDALFGPETRAAIRRYQFEIKGEMTGYLTAEQATRLVNDAH
jgi:hypothetical protein